MKTCVEPLAPTQQSVRNALFGVIDPEIGENIVDLGFVYRIEIDGNVAKVTLTMTTPACPMGEMLLDDIHATLTRTHAPHVEFDLHLVWEPPWNPGMISADAKQRLGWASAEALPAVPD